jgi:hypothetical protein
MQERRFEVAIASRGRSSAGCGEFECGGDVGNDRSRRRGPVVEGSG